MVFLGKGIEASSTVRYNVVVSQCTKSKGLESSPSANLVTSGSYGGQLWVGVVDAFCGQEKTYGQRLPSVQWAFCTCSVDSAHPQPDSSC